MARIYVTQPRIRIRQRVCVYVVVGDVGVVVVSIVVVSIMFAGIHVGVSVVDVAVVVGVADVVDVGGVCANHGCPLCYCYGCGCCCRRCC